MLKYVLVNSKKVPVPVPVRTLAEALAWLEHTLVPTGHTITRVALDEQLIGSSAEAALLRSLQLSASSKLEIQIESPAELTLQTLDATRNLSEVINGGLKFLAVACWQARGGAKPQELEGVCNDLQLVLELIDHATSLLDHGAGEVAALQGIAGLIKRTAAALGMAKANSDWKGCARLLLNRLEPLLKDLTNETESLQIHLMAQGGPGLARAGNQPT
jgi:hypothetical protein